MDTLSLHIEYLLQCHDCVTLPGLGALLAHGVAPVYDNDSERWVAPSRAVSFNPDIVRTDGLLAQSLARREGMSHEQAAQKVERCMTDFRRMLDEGTRVTLGHIGALVPSGHGTPVFEPSPDWARRSPAVMWLPDVEVRPCDDEVRFAEGVARARLSGRGSVPGLIGRAAACIAVLFALGWVVTDNLRSGNETQYASVTPVETPSLIERPGEVSAPIVWLMRHHDDAVVEVEPKPVRRVVTDAPGYYLVVASLANMKEAEGFMAQYPGQEFGVLRADGRYRVYTHSASNASELYTAAAAPAFAGRFPSSWVCRR